MDLESLRAAAAVLVRGSFAAVARDLGVEPSSVSRMIATVEAELGFRLFQRSTRRLAPTEAGAAYLAKLTDVLAELDAATDEALESSVAPSGVLRLTASVAFGTTCIVPLLPEFRDLYPRLTLDLVFSDDNLDLVKDRIDLAVRLAPSVAGDLVCSKLMETRYRVVATPAYWKRTGLPGSPADLAAHRCLLFSLPAYRTRWIFQDGAGRREEVRIGGDVVFSNAFALFHAMLMDMGPALLPDWLMAGDLEEGVLVDPFPDRRATATTFDTAAWLIYPSRAFLPGKVRVAIDFLKMRLPAAGVPWSPTLRVPSPGSPKRARLRRAGPPAMR